MKSSPKSGTSIVSLRTADAGVFGANPKAAINSSSPRIGFGNSAGAIWLGELMSFILRRFETAVAWASVKGVSPPGATAQSLNAPFSMSVFDWAPLKSIVSHPFSLHCHERRHRESQGSRAKCTAPTTPAAAATATAPAGASAAPGRGPASRRAGWVFVRADADTARCTPWISIDVRCNVGWHEGGITSASTRAITRDHDRVCAIDEQRMRVNIMIT